MARKVTIHVFKGNKRRKRPGVHAKTKGTNGQKGNHTCIQR